MSDILYPWGYEDKLVTFDELCRRLELHPIHPEFYRRLTAWIEAQGGNIGIGSGWRAYGNSVSTASSNNQSFHQIQKFASGIKCFSAVDLVAINDGKSHRSPYWREVPAQDSLESLEWGLHCNVGNPPNGEPWHMQCIEMDGFGSWLKNGRRDPVANYPLPREESLPVITTEEEEDMAGFQLVVVDMTKPEFPSGVWYLTGQGSKTWIADGGAASEINERLAECSEGKPSEVDGQIYKRRDVTSDEALVSYGPIVGPRHESVDEYGR
jgi:hypothetical protein